MSRTLFVVNPVSGGKGKSSLVNEIKSLDKDVEIYLTKGNDDQQNINDLLQHSSPDRVIVAGGDGTIAMVASEMIGNQTPLGIIPMGSANGLANELAIPAKPDEALKKAISEPPKPFDIIEINNQWHVLHMADFGMNATLVKRYQNDDHRGFIGYALSGLKEITNLMNNSVFDLKINGKLETLESPMVIIANARRYGTGIEVNPIGQMDDGKFEVCCLQGLSFPAFLNQIIEKKQFDFSPFNILSADTAKINLREERDFQIDGEYMGQVQYLNLKALQGAIQLVY